MASPLESCYDMCHKQTQQPSLMPRYSALPQFDLDMQTSGKSIRSITISRRTKVDGTVVRRKETLLVDGTCLVDEISLSKPTRSSSSTLSIAAPSNIQVIPTTIESPSVETILPLHKLPTSNQNKSAQCFRIACIAAATVLVILVFVQGILFFDMKKGGPIGGYLSTQTSNLD